MRATKKEKEFIYNTPNLSTLFNVAIDEYIRIRDGKDDNIVLNMYAYHDYIESEDACNVCLAGAVMDGVLGADRKRFMLPGYFLPAIKRRLEAINYLRLGHVASAKYTLFNCYDNDNKKTKIYNALEDVHMTHSGKKKEMMLGTVNLPEWKSLAVNLAHCERVGSRA